MSWSLTIGRFGATTVRVHLTFFLLLAWIGVSAWEKGGLPAARDSVLFIALIFACVILHDNPFKAWLQERLFDAAKRAQNPAPPAT